MITAHNENHPSKQKGKNQKKMVEDKDNSKVDKK
jgi:hypothetical protein